MDGSYILLFFFSLYLSNKWVFNIHAERKNEFRGLTHTPKNCEERIFFSPTDLFDVKKDSLFLSSHDRDEAARTNDRETPAFVSICTRGLSATTHTKAREFSRWEREKKKTEAKTRRRDLSFWVPLDSSLIFFLSRVSLKKIILFFLLVYTHMRMICEN